MSHVLQTFTEEKNFSANLCDLWKCDTPQRSSATDTEWICEASSSFVKSLGRQNSVKETKQAAGAATRSQPTKCFCTAAWASVSRSGAEKAPKHAVDSPRSHRWPSREENWRFLELLEQLPSGEMLYSHIHLELYEFIGEIGETRFKSE